MGEVENDIEDEQKKVQLDEKLRKEKESEEDEENQRMVEEINLSTKQTERDAAKLIVDESDNGNEIQAKQQEQSSD